jgi:uncharacterized protein YdcH (DUF465 family)
LLGLREIRKIELKKRDSHFLLLGQQRNRVERRIYGGSHSKKISSLPSEETEKRLLFTL